MKLSIAIKAALAGTMVLASTAYADIALPSTGNGELALFVRDEVTNSVYARGLQINMDSFVSQPTASGTYTGPTSVSYSITPISADGNLSAFLSTGHTYTWGILAGDSVGSNTAVGTRRYLFSSTADATVAGNISSNSSLAALASGENQFFNDVNANLPDVAGSSVYGANSSGGLWGDPTSASGANANVFFSNLPGTSNAAVGTAQSLYLFANSSSTNSADARVFYAASQLVLTAGGTLQSVGGTTPPPVPLPAAAWLLGSGLLGLVGVGRRRRTPVVEA